MLNQGYSPRSIIFHKLYSVKVRNVESLSIDYIKTYGLPYTGNKKIDSDYANQIVEKYVTIVQLVEWHENGVAMAFPNIEEVIEMYEVIRQHLKDFKQFVNNSIHVNTVPIDDLQKLSNFASSIYRHIPNKEKYKEEVDVEILGIDNNNPFDISTIFRKVSKDEELRENQERDKNYYSSQYVIPEQDKGPHVSDFEEIKNKTQYRRQDWLQGR